MNKYIQTGFHATCGTKDENAMRLANAGFRRPRIRRYTRRTQPESVLLNTIVMLLPIAFIATAFWLLSSQTFN